MTHLSITRTAEVLRVTRFTVYRHLDLVDVAGVFHVEPAAVLRFLSAHIVLPDQQEPTPMTKEIPRLYTLDEVVQLHPHLSLRTLADDARAKRFEHIHYGRKRLMTAEQIERLLKAKTVPAAEDEALAQVRRRRSGRRRVAA